LKNPGFFLLVRFWIAPGAEARVLGWLEGGHVAEVLRQPGFLWCRRVALPDADASGWRGYAMIYGIASKADFDAYNGNQALLAEFARQREPFAKNLRIERVAGEVDFALDAPI
jgi:hypothetical protein